jgi:hypothetical protein
VLPPPSIFSLVFNRSKNSQCGLKKGKYQIQRGPEESASTFTDGETEVQVKIGDYSHLFSDEEAEEASKP